MKLTKRDVAEGLGMIYIDVRDRGYYDYHVFEFRGKEILVGSYTDIERAWEEAAEKLLEPLADYLLGNLDD